MASGKAIDEQHDECWSSNVLSARATEAKHNSSSSRSGHNQEPTPPRPSLAEDYDPNDVVVDPSTRTRLQVVPGGLRPPTDDYDSDDSDFS